MQSFNTTKDWRARGYTMRRPPLILVGYDPAGAGDDRDALTMTAREEHQRGERHDPDFAVMTAYRVLMAHRMPPELEFPDKAAQVLRLHLNLLRWRNSGRSSGHAVCVETNGVGYALGSLLRTRIEAHVFTYTTVGAVTDVTAQEKRLVMPRLAALDNLRVLAETHALKIAKGAPGGQDLVREMNAFVWRRPGRPEASPGQHDDLVMSLAGATWIGSKVIPPQLKAERITAKGRAH